ncbi:MAG TPA: FecR family protein [Candidatus Paceibacterota bacterium]
MKKIIIVAVVVLIVILGWLKFSPKSDLPVDTQEVQASTKAWIQVENAKVSRVDENGQELGVVTTGDGVEAGEIIKTDATGLASIYFSDGSTMRIDPNSSLKISEAGFDDNSGSLKVKVTLLSGKVWSKITALATPDSLWEVRTATAVATVRGSAFGTEVTDSGDTLIVGSEHDIAVFPLDEKGEVLKDREVILAQNELLKIGRDKIFEKKERKNEKTIQAWIEHNEGRDNKIRDKVKELKDKGLDGKELRQELRKSLDDLNEADKNEEGDTLEDSTEKDIDLKDANDQSARLEQKLKINNSVQLPRPTIISLEIKARSELKVIEGASIEFEASAVLSDGTKKILTDGVDWQVVGSIGKMSKPGIFQATLGADVSEIGTAFGAITATFKSENGKEFSAKSEIITVTGAVGEDTRG